MRKIMLMAACLAALALFAGCTLEQGGTEDPAGFETVKGLDQSGPEATAQNEAAASAAEALLQGRLAALESENAALRTRVDELEGRLTERSAAVDARLAALEAGAEAAAAQAEEKAPVDMSDDKAFKEKVVRQGLEQILNMSRLLLDKMEYEMNGKMNEGGDSAAASGKSASQTTAQ